jgi:hypothetical protein
MKKLIYLVLVTILIISSCKKDSVVMIVDEHSKPAIIIEKNRLNFANSELFRQKLRELKEMEDEQIENHMAEYYYNGFKPLKPYYKESDIELRQNYAQTMQQKLKSNNQDEDMYDELIADDEFAAFLNEDLQIQVGDTLYKYTEYGLFFAHIDKEDELLEYVRNVTRKKSSLKYVEPCEMPLSETGIVAVKNDDVYRFIPEPDCGGGGSGGGGTSSGGSSSGGTSITGDQFVANLPICDSKKSFWNILGTVRVCDDKYDDRHRIRTKYWRHNYLIAASIGVSVKSQKRTLGIWWAHKADELRLGINQAYFEFTMPQMDLRQTPKMLIAYQGKLYNDELQFLKYITDDEYAKFPFHDKYNCVDFWVNLPIYGYTNATVTTHEVNKFIQQKIWDKAKSLGKKS